MEGNVASLLDFAKLESESRVLYPESRESVGGEW